MIKPIVEAAFRLQHNGESVDWHDVVIDIHDALQSRKPAIFRRENYEDAGRVIDEMIREGYRLQHWDPLFINGYLVIVMLFFPDPHPEGTVDVLWMKSHIQDWRDAQPSGEARAAFDKMLELLP